MLSLYKQHTGDAIQTPILHSIPLAAGFVPLDAHQPAPSIMANTMPIPLPPRTPTPPPDEPSSPLRLPAFDPEALVDNNSLSPHPIERDYMMSPTTPERSSANGNGPFNFQPAAMAKSPVIKSVRGPSFLSIVLLTALG